MQVSLEVSTAVKPTFRVKQMAGMFDVSIEAKSRQSFEVELPDASEEWQIGAIVGPSGSGKSSIARHVYGRELYEGGKWPKDESVLDGFEAESIKDITALLTAVGFASPPSWVKPFRVLSNGEQFRAELARALLSSGELVVFDEFTSVVDRTVAQIGSAAVAKAIRSGRVGERRRFVAVTCHYDVLDWLEPDWVLDMATKRLVRGRLRRRPRIALEILPCTRAAWPLFRQHHYLSGSLHCASQCYLAAWRGRPVAFCGVLHDFRREMKTRGRCRKVYRVSRLVTLPDYQGVGIGGALLDAVAALYHNRGMQVTITTGHPAMMRALQRSARWKCHSVLKHGASVSRALAAMGWKLSTGRAVANFSYIERREP